MQLCALNWFCFSEAFGGVTSLYDTWLACYFWTWTRVFGAITCFGNEPDLEPSQSYSNYTLHHLWKSPYFVPSPHRCFILHVWAFTSCPLPSSLPVPLCRILPLCKHIPITGRIVAQARCSSGELVHSAVCFCRASNWSCTLRGCLSLGAQHDFILGQSTASAAGVGPSTKNRWSLSTIFLCPSGGLC